MDRRPEGLKQVLMSQAMRRQVFDEVENDWGAVGKAFVAMNAEDALKTKPKVGGVDDGDGVDGEEMRGPPR